MTTHYQLVFMPHLSLAGRDGIEVGGAEIWNFDKQKMRIQNDSIRVRIDELLGMYRHSGRSPATSARLRDIGIVIVGAPDFRVLSPAEFDGVQEARYLLFLSCLAHNCLQYGRNSGHMMVTSENFDVIRQNFTLDSAYITESTGIILNLQIGGYKIAETIFTKPSYVNLPSRFNTDDKLLHELQQLSSKNPVLYRRITRAAALFLESYYNSHSVDIGARVLLQVAAFEVLFDLPERNPRMVFKDRIESLLSTSREKHYDYKFEVARGYKRELRTLKGIWADRFYTLRNHIIHGEEVRPRAFLFLRQQHHLAAAPLMFTVSIKKLLDKELQVAKSRVPFFERVDWRLIDEGDEFEPRRIGFKAQIDHAARVQHWIDHRDEESRHFQPRGDSALEDDAAV